jgi:hypothetical protein
MVQKIKNKRYQKSIRKHSFMEINRPNKDLKNIEHLLKEKFIIFQSQL